MAVLGSMLIEREAAEKALDVLHESDFYLDPHRRIFRSLYALFGAGQAIDVVTVSEELWKKSELDAVGGGSYLAELINKVTTAAHVEYYARLVKERRSCATSSPSRPAWSPPATTRKKSRSRFSTRPRARS